MINNINYPFVGTWDKYPRKVAKDYETFEEWRDRKISTKEASLRVAHNNYARVLDDDEFIEVAHGLGFFRSDEQPSWAFEYETMEVNNNEQSN